MHICRRNWLAGAPSEVYDLTDSWGGIRGVAEVAGGRTLAFVNPPKNTDPGSTYFVELDEKAGLKILLKLDRSYSQAALNPDGSIMYTVLFIMLDFDIIPAPFLPARFRQRRYHWAQRGVCIAPKIDVSWYCPVPLRSRVDRCASGGVFFLSNFGLQVHQRELPSLERHHPGVRASALRPSSGQLDVSRRGGGDASLAAGSAPQAGCS